MEKRNNNFLVIILILIIVILLGGFGYLYFNDKISINSEEINGDHKKNTDDNFQSNNLNSVGIDYEKFVEKFGDYSKYGYSYIKSISITNGEDNYSVGLTIDGKIIINFDKELENVKNVVDILTGYDYADSNGNKLYILDADGYLYIYTANDYKNGILEAKKLDEYKNVTKIFEYYTIKKNAGGCNKIVIESDNNYIELNSSCV